jgi:hypothetical protein
MVVASGDHGIASEMQGLRESDREVLELLRNEPASSVGFQGLKRRLHLHPEKLSRALRRLERDDLVEKTDLGYRIGERARELLTPTAMKPANPSIPILQTFLPPEVDLQELATFLRGKWFGALRWYGLMETPEELTLSWLSEDEGIQIDARLRTGALSIDAHFAEASQFPAATMAGHELFQHIAQAYGRVRMNG